MRTKVSTFLFGVVMCAFAGLCAAEEHSASAGENPAADDVAASVYRTTCGYCHDHVGVAPTITGRKLPSILTETLVRSGVGAMPAFRETEISDDELKLLADWLASSSN